MKAFKLGGFLFILILLFTVGCSDSSSSSNDSSGKSGSDDKITLNFYDWLDEENYMTAVIEKFEEENPDIKVNANFVPTSEYEQKLLVNMSSGEGLDVFAVQGFGLLAQYQDKGQLLEMSDYINLDELSNISPLIDQMKIDGGIYGLPHRAGAWALYYNKDIFDERGVPYPDNTWTWEKYREVAKELTYEREDGEQVWGSINYDPTSAWWRVPANTAGYNNPNESEDLEAFKKDAKFFYELTYVDKAQQPYTDLVGEAGKDYTGRFLQGKHAMMFNGDWEVEMLNSAMEEGSNKVNYDIAPLPYFEGEEPRSAGSATAVMVAKNTKHPEAAAKLATFLVSEQAAEIIAGYGLLPAWQSDVTTGAFVDRLDVPEHAEVFFERPINSQVPIDDPLYQEGMSILTEEMSLYLLQEKELDETFDFIQERINDEILDK